MKNILFEQRCRDVVLLLLLLLQFASATFYRGSAGPGSNNLIKPESAFGIINDWPNEKHWTSCVKDMNEAQESCNEKNLYWVDFNVNDPWNRISCGNDSYYYACSDWPESWMGIRYLTSCVKDKNKAKGSCKEKGLFQVVSDSPDYLIPCDDNVFYRYICTDWPKAGGPDWTAAFSEDNAKAWGYGDGKDAVANLAVDWCDVHNPPCSTITDFTYVGKTERNGVYFYAWKYSKMWTPCLTRMIERHERCAEKSFYRGTPADTSKNIIQCKVVKGQAKSYKYLCEDWPVVPTEVPEYFKGRLWAPYFPIKDTILGYDGFDAVEALAQKWCKANRCQSIGEYYMEKVYGTTVYLSFEYFLY